MGQRIVHHVASVTPAPVMRSQGALSLRRSRLVQRRIATGFYTFGILVCLAAMSHAAYGFFTEAPYFKLRDIQISGVSNPVQEELTELVTSIVGPHGNLLSLNEDNLSAQIIRHPRIRDLKLQTTLDGILMISALERKPLAILDAREHFYLIDNDAYVMQEIEASEAGEHQIPFISGVAQEEVQVGEKILNPSLPKVLSLLQVVRERNTEFFNNISEVEMGFDTASHLENITVHMIDGLDVRFGDRDPLGCMPAFEMVAAEIRKKEFNLYKDILYVDMRFEGMGLWLHRDWSYMIDANIQPEVEAELQAAAETNSTKSRSPERESQSESNATGSSRRAGSQGNGQVSVPSSAYDLPTAR